MEENFSVLQALEWSVEAGADEAVGESPVNRLESHAEEQSFVPAVVEMPRPAAVSPQPVVAASPATAELAEKAATLDELRAAMESFDGCALKKTAQNLVFGDGNPHAALMIIGEAPGAEEDRQGVPFVGVSGHLLDKMLTSIGLDRSAVYITNVVSWRPPNNRKPSEDEIALLLPFIRRHIALVKPKMLLFLGGSALSALTGVKEGIMRARGKWVSYRDGDFEIPALPSYHPAFLLRTPAQKKNSWHDFLAVKHALEQ